MRRLARRGRSAEHGSVDKRIYQRTEAGDRAAKLVGSGLPQEVLRLLRFVDGETPVAAVAALQDLEAIGLVESVSVDWLDELVELGNYASCGSACCCSSPTCTCSATVS